MLKKILSPRTCALCRICCCFDDEDIWETPVVDEELKERITAQKLPDAEFVPHNGSYLFKMVKDEKNGLYFCPGLDRKKGCVLGDCKPFDCRIWPFRVMRLEGKNVLTLSPVCPHVGESSLNDISSVAKEIAPLAFAYAKEFPGAVKDYIKGYPIFAIE